MKYIVTLLVTCLLFSCYKEELETFTIPAKKEVQFQQISYPYLIDELENEKKTFKKQTFLDYGNYNPLYIGPLADTISIKYSIQFEEFFLNDDWETSFPYWADEGLDLSIIIDTNRNIANKDWIWVGEGDFAKILYKANSIYITNHSRQTYYIGYGSHIPFILEAKNPQGQWQTIEEQYIYSCGLGLNRIILPSQHMLVTSVPLFEGDFSTKLRLKLGNYYSHEFSGKIFLSQFTSEYIN